MARIMKDGFCKSWAILPGGRVCISNYEEGPEYWARTMATHALERALGSENPLDRSKPLEPQVLTVLLPWAETVSSIVQGVM